MPLSTRTCGKITKMKIDLLLRTPFLPHTSRRLRSMAAICKHGADKRTLAILRPATSASTPLQSSRLHSPSTNGRCWRWSSRRSYTRISMSSTSDADNNVPCARYSRQTPVSETIFRWSLSLTWTTKFAADHLHGCAWHSINSPAMDAAYSL